MARPQMWLLAGPNGAGKSTLAHTHFRNIIERGDFLNADDIAASVSPGHPRLTAIEAGRRMIDARRAAIAEGRNLVVETTLASRTLLRAARTARGRGFMLGLIYLWIADPELCNQRIAIRVAKGGHFVPSDVVIRRYGKSLLMLPLFMAEVEKAYIFSANEAPALIAEKDEKELKILRETDWAQIRSAMA